MLTNGQNIVDDVNKLNKSYNWNLLLGLIPYREEDTSSKLPSNRQSPLGVFHSKGDVIAGSYKIIGILGQGGVATTYKAIAPYSTFVVLNETVDDFIWQSCNDI